MGMTITEKILASRAGRAEIRPGDLVSVPVDVILANDITGPLAIHEFRKIGVEKVCDPAKVILVPDHFAPNKDIKAAEQCRILRDFAREQGLTHYFEVGRMGIEHALLPEKGLVVPGDVIIGADSHTCTYGALGAFSTGIGSTDLAAAMAIGEIWFKVPESMRFEFTGTLPEWVGGKDLILNTIGRIGVDGARYRAMEFTGPALRALLMDDRFTMANMAIEAGAKSGIFHVDEFTLAYVEERATRPYRVFSSDEDAAYVETHTIDAGGLEPQVAFPHSPANVRPVSEGRGIEIEQVVIGSCTNGRLSDLRIAAGLLAGRTVHPRVRTMVIPATQEIYLQAMSEGLLRVFVEAGAAVSTPTCGPCLGGHMGVLAEGERCVATTNRNFLGRMGHPSSEIYLAGPAVAAASAVLGRIAHPGEVAA
ncbi:MAG: 3-isopropylmalate dehydratase large subunit [Firmicutes bacterium]|nr:3-isopropylmalate dehydratase large subunit [Bacillota bacterium]